MRLQSDREPTCPRISFLEEICHSPTRAAGVSIKDVYLPAVAWRAATLCSTSLGPRTAKLRPGRIRQMKQKRVRTAGSRPRATLALGEQTCSWAAGKHDQGKRKVKEKV